MEPIGWHITARLVDDRVIAGEPASRRLAARVLLRAGADAGLIVFRVVDTHLHALLAAPRERVGRFNAVALGTLVQVLRLPIGFEPARARPIEDQRHLRNALDYVLRNDRRHEAGGDPWHEASNLPDLLGLRVCGLYTAATVRRLLPRVTRADLLAHLGVAELPAGPVAAEHLHDAALAAAGVVTLTGRAPEVVAVRVAAAAAGLGPNETAAALGTTDRAVHRLHKLPADPALVEAIRRQCAWRAAAPTAPVAFVAPAPVTILPPAPPPTSGPGAGMWAAQPGAARPT